MAATAMSEKTGKSSLMPLLATIGGLTVVGAGGGFAAGTAIVAKVRGSLTASAMAATAPTAALVTKTAIADDAVIRELKPIVTNLAQPEGTKVRLQASILYNKKDVEQPNVISAQITDDLVAYLKTLSIAQLQGGSGLASLREDLNERVATRSNGQVRELIIETLVVQ